VSFRLPIHQARGDECVDGSNDDTQRLKNSLLVGVYEPDVRADSLREASGKRPYEETPDADEQSNEILVCGRQAFPSCIALLNNIETEGECSDADGERDNEDIVEKVCELWPDEASNLRIEQSNDI